MILIDRLRSLLLSPLHRHGRRLAVINKRFLYSHLSHFAVAENPPQHRPRLAAEQVQTLSLNGDKCNRGHGYACSDDWLYNQLIRSTPSQGSTLAKGR
jgi:hypothetical protein